MGTILTKGVYGLVIGLVVAGVTLLLAAGMAGLMDWLRSELFQTAAVVILALFCAGGLLYGLFEGWQDAHSK